MKETKGKYLKMLLMAAAVLFVFFCLPISPFNNDLAAVQAATGPDKRDGSESYIYVYSYDDYDYKYLYYCDSGQVDSSYKGSYSINGGTASYDASTNTLTLNNISLDLVKTQMMGDDFKIRLVGSNTVEEFRFNASSYYEYEDDEDGETYIEDLIIYGNSCTFIGTGSVLCTQIFLDSAWTNSFVKVDDMVTVSVQGRGGYRPLVANRSKNGDVTQVFIANGIIESDFDVEEEYWSINDGPYNAYYIYARKGTSVTMKGNKRLDISKASVTIPAQTYNYTGKAITPEPSVIYDGEKLVKGKDYQVSYANNTNAGTATVTISGINAYQGTKKITFVIKRNTTPNPPKPSTNDNNNSAQKNQQTQPSYNKTGKIKSLKSSRKRHLCIKWKKVSGASGYQSMHSRKKSFKNTEPSRIDYSKKKTKEDFYNWPSGTWYLKIRPYKKINGKKVYGKWSKVRKVKVK